MSVHSSRASIRPAARSLLSAPRRSFSCSAVLFQNQVPPESPSYIRLPQPPQSDEHKQVRVKGHLPVPREVFARGDGERKVSKEYIDKATKLPAKGVDETRWKDVVAQSRRDNLEQGLAELWKRKTRDDTAARTRSTARMEENRRLAHAPERRDDVLTRSTVLDALLDTKVYPDPKRFGKADRSRARVATIENTKREARRDAIMEMYINASNFITKESELKEELDKVFSEDYFRKKGQSENSAGMAENVWGVYGAPSGTTEMLQWTMRKSAKSLDQAETSHDRAAARQKKLAEELTGGKMGTDRLV